MTVDFFDRALRSGAIPRLLAEKRPLAVIQQDAIVERPVAALAQHDIEQAIAGSGLGLPATSMMTAGSIWPSLRSKRRLRS
jgi:hypothetical protein